MEHYIVSARKYRPATFESVVGQSVLTTTLKNAIASGKLAHAYLFCGPRGVGKTTCARIFARTINCLSPTASGEACGVCESCRAFNEQRSYNIHELDAASNNSVEDIRSLIEQVRIPPQVGRYKVFIIDEVHMLSTAAFNAFLKTLEEPPAHAIFILATTEKHKILPTILSRCQIYDFNRMEVEDIVNHLKRVADNEHIQYEEEALGVIARKADGGMRDALSIFDQVVSFSEGSITYKKVIENLNVLDYDYYFKLTDQLLAAEVPAALLTLNEILSKGFEANFFMGGLAAHFRDLLVSRDAVTLPLLEVSETVRQRYQEQAMRCKPQFLYRALKLCNDCDINYRTSRNKRLLVELTLIQVAQASSDDDAGCGLGPTKKLKPIFQAVKQQQPSTAPAEPVVAPKAEVQKTVQPKTTTVQVQPAPQPQIPARGKVAKTISIRVQQTQPTVVTATPDPVSTLAEPEEQYASREFEEKDLNYQWFRFANSLPKEKSAMAGRLKNMKPRLSEKTKVSVSVENEQVLQYMLGLKDELTRFLRRELGNGHVTVDFHVMTIDELPKAYSKKEQYAAMLQKSPELASLRALLGLELA